MTFNLYPILFSVGIVASHCHSFTVSVTVSTISSPVITEGNEIIVAKTVTITLHHITSVKFSVNAGLALFK